MRKVHLLTVAGSLVAAVGTVIALAVPAYAATVRYVALGDSYSSGVGSGSYIASSGSCLRSSKAYSALWAARHSPTSYRSVACSGAKTTDVITSQVSALSASTTLVSITIGGNDVGFATIMQTCVLHGSDACVAAVNNAEAIVRSQMPSRLASTYAAIRRHAPYARVVVLGYPAFYQLHVWYCVGLSERSRAKIDEGINLLDSVTATAAARAGFIFGDVRSRFVGHQLCSGDKWIHALNVSHLTESYHPFASGQSGGYLPVLTNAAD